MPNMPEKDPGLWAAVLAWVLAHQPQLYAAGLSVAIAALRIVYGGGSTRQILEPQHPHEQRLLAHG